MAAIDKEPHSRRRTIPHLKTRVRLLARSAIRNSDLGLFGVAAVLGIGIAFGVAATRQLVSEIHHLLYGVPFETHLSGTLEIERWRLAVMPCLGGLIYGLIAYAMWRWRPRDIVDAIEANALHGGRMSLSDSLRLTALTILSAGAGASVGLEAAFTQLGAGTASRVGRLLHLRRIDLRTIVGCGASAAIAAAFNAPLAGAFYAFELIIGSYTLATMAPVLIAAVAATLVTRVLFGEDPIFVTYHQIELSTANYIMLALVGVAAAGVAIAAMYGVTFAEQWSRRLKLPVWARPAFGGLVLGAIACFYPQVLGSGHGGILSTLGSPAPAAALAGLTGLLLAKIVASAVSIGSGFRGGMFSSSLYLGSLFGAAISALVHRLTLPWLPTDHAIFVLAGMGAVAAGVVGAPVTMILLVLEATADFSATLGVTVSVIVAVLVVRHWFGYSFATWRFHLRGVALHSPHDIGWLHELRVGKLMRQDFAVVPPTLQLAELRRQFPLGTERRVFVVNGDGRYEGCIDLADAHAGDDRVQADQPVGDLAHDADHFLTPEQPVRDTLDLFIASAAETLAVVDNRHDRRVLGYLNEAYALRRYYRELEARHQEELGDDALFTSTRAPGEH